MALIELDNVITLRWNGSTIRMNDDPKLRRRLLRMDNRMKDKEIRDAWNILSRPFIGNEEEHHDLAVEKCDSAFILHVFYPELFSV